MTVVEGLGVLGLSGLGLCLEGDDSGLVVVILLLDLFNFV